MGFGELRWKKLGFRPVCDIGRPLAGERLVEFIKCCGGMRVSVRRVKGLRADGN